MLFFPRLLLKTMQIFIFFVFIFSFEISSLVLKGCINILFSKLLWQISSTFVCFYQGSDIWDGMSTIKCLFWNANDSIVKLMVSITSGVFCDTDLVIKRSSLKHYTSNNTRQHKTTRDNTTQHETTRVQHETTRVQHDTTRHNTSTTRHNTRQHDSTRVQQTQHKYNTSQHE